MKQNNSYSSPFNDMASEYDAWFDKDGSLIFFIEVQAFKALLPALPKPWLEVGVGSGRFAQALGIETGVDPSSKLLQMARRRGVNAFLGRGEQEFFDEESFGTVFLIVTLCFLDSPLDVLIEAKRILAPGGKLVLGLVLKESPWGQLYQQKKEEGHRFYRYATFYSCDEVVRLIVQAGFTTEKIVSTLFQRPRKVQHVEESKEGYFPDAGFTIMVAGKKTVTTEVVKCKRCGREISEKEQYEYLGETLCEDCYIDIRYPAKACDLWAVYSATRSRETLGLKGTEGLTKLQKAIYEFVRGKSKATREQLIENFGLTEAELQTQLATLRHCELEKANEQLSQVLIELQESR